MTNITSLTATAVKIFVFQSNVCESKYVINDNCIAKSSCNLVVYENNKLRHYNSKSPGDNYTDDDVNSIFVDGIFLHYFLKELRQSPLYRKCVVKQLSRLMNYAIVFIIKPANKEIIDYQWAHRASRIAWERAELDHAMSWLSTLGGAFSALGEEFSHCAEMAGRISFHQLGLAIRLGDPMTVARCKLYLSMSMMQRGSLRLARHIILEQYNMAKNCSIRDTRLINMCKGMWSKLQYCWKMNKNKKNLN